MPVRTPTSETTTGSADTASGLHLLRTNTINEASLARLSLGSATAFIGGGCCVHLSVEYMPLR